ncbi:autotransporter-associated beta strand repeat-containing protein (plasmid) [Methylobacterium currus]|nr:autotransporter-associated beta strand repeat-containing protein [Methylobacterium currus]
MTGTGSTWTNAGTLYVGNEGTGTLSVAAGGHVTSAGAYIGTGGSSTGTVMVSGQGSLWQAGSGLMVGYSNGTTSTVTISDGGQVEAGTATFGEQAGSLGTMEVTGTGSKFVAGSGASDAIKIGRSGSGSLTVAAGGGVEGRQLVIGGSAGGTGAVLVTGSGSSVTLTGDLIVGAGTTGTLTLAEGGQVGAGYVTLGNSSGVAGTLVVGAASGQAAVAPGTLNATLVYFGPGTGKVVFNHTGTTTFATPIDGGGEVRKEGSGTTILTGAHTYSGPTTVSGGALTLTGSINTATGTMTVGNATVAVSGGGSSTLGAVYIGKDAGTSGVMTVSGANTTLATTSDLKAGERGTGSLTIDTGATITVGGITYIGDVDNPTTPTMSGSGSLTVSGTGSQLTTNGLYLRNVGAKTSTLTVSGGAVVDDKLGLYTLGGNSTITVSGTGTVLNVGSLTSRPATWSTSDGWFSPDSGNIALSSGALLDADGSYIGGNGTATMVVSGAGTRWLNGLPLYIGGTGNGNAGTGTVTVSDGAYVKSSTSAVGVDPGATGTLTLTGVGTIYEVVPNAAQGSPGNMRVGFNGTGTVTVSDGALLKAANQINIATNAGSVGVLNIGAAASAAAAAPGSLDGGTLGVVFGDGTGTLVFNHTDTAYSFAASISGAGQVQQVAGTTLLTGANTYTGGTTITAGTLSIGAGGEDGSVSGDIANAGALIFNRANDLAYAGAISGSGTLEKKGAGTLTLTGASTHTGGTTISGGTLSIGDGNTSGSVTGPIANNSTLVFNRSDNLTYGDVISGSGSLVKTGAGTLTLTGTNTYTGLTTVKAGRLDVTGSADHLGDPAGAIVVESAGVLRLGMGQTMAKPMTLAGGTVSVAGGNNTYSGAITLTADSTIDVQDDSTTFSGGITGAGKSLMLFTAGTITMTGAIATGSGGLTINGYFPVILTAENTYTGVTRIATGTLQVGAGGTSGSIVGDVVTEYGAVNSSVLPGHLQFNRSDDLTYAGAISGSGTLEQAGGGVLTLTGAGTLTGGTTISAGTIQIGNGGTAGSLAGAIANSGALIFNRSDDLTYADVISGTGTLEKKGAGTLTLSGANTLTGATTVSAGTLALTGSLAGNVAVSSGAALSGAGSVGGKLTIANGGTFSGASGGTFTVTGDLAQGATSQLNLTLGAPTTTAVVSAANLTLAGTLNLTPRSGFASGSYRLIDYSGTLTDHTLAIGTAPSHSLYRVDTGTSHQVNLVVAAGQWWNGATTSAGGSSVAGGTGTWDVAAAATNWTDASGAAANAWGQGGLAIFAGTAGTVTVGGATPPQTAGMEFLTEGYSVTGGSIALTAFSAGTAPTILTDSGFTATIGSALTGTDGLEKTGTGRLILTGANTYTGGTTISAGTLQVGTGGTSGSLAGDIVNKGALVFYRSDDLAYAGVVSGTGTLEKLGAGTLTLSGTTAGISGQVTIGAGGLTLTHDQAQAMLTGNIVDNGALTIYRNTADGIYAGSISGTGTLTKTGAKNLYLTGANTYTGGTTISAGQITIGQGGATGSIAGDVAIASGAGLGYYRTGTETFAGNISGAGSWGVGGGLTLTYTGASTTTGIVYMQASTVQVGDGGTAGSIAGDIVTDFQGANPGHLIFNRSDDLTYAGAISGSGTLEKKGAGTLTLTGASTLTGGTTITAGTLSIGAGGTSGSLTGAIANSGALVFDRSDALTYAGVVSGTGTLEKKGAGTLTLSGAHTYTGGTTVTAGTLSIGAGGTSGSVTGDITNAGALVFDRSDAVAYAGVVSGTGSLEQKGAGTLTLTGAQTYTGNTTVTAGTLRLTGSINAPAGTVQVGDATFATAGGGQLTAQGIGIGVAAGTSGTATVDGTGSGWTIGSDRIGVGRDGTGTLTISGGATVSSPGAIIGWNSTGTGTATVTGTGSTWTNAGTLYVGNGGTGTLSVAAGGHVTSAGAYIGTGGSSTGTVMVSGQGSLWEAGNALIAGYSAGTTGHVTISGGGQVKAVIATLGEQAGSTGTMQVTGAGSKLIAVNDGTPYAGNINVGQNGSGRLTVAAGGAVEGGKLYIGNDSGSGAVSVAGAGSSVTLASTLTVGADANGTLTLSDGGQVSASSVTIGNSPGVSGTLAIGAASGQAAAAPGALAANSIRFGAGNGRLVLNHTGAAYTIAAPISGGGQVRQEGGGATLLTGANTYTGGTTITSGTLSIGAGGTSGSLAGDIANAGALVFDRSDAVTYAGVISGSGTLAQKGTGTLTLTGANTLTGGTTITAGTLSIGDGGTAGSLTGAIANAAALVFNRSDDLTYADVISGAGTLEKTGAGTLTLSGANTLTGATTVSAGTLALTGSLAGNVAVSSGATLSGAGTISGKLTIANGGALAGKSGSTLTVTGDLAQGATSQLNLTLGAPTTTAVVSAANLTLAGTLNLTPRSGFASGSYRLIDYSGTLTDLTLAIGTAPSRSLYRVDTGTSHQVNLVVAAGQWWNGAVTSAGGTAVAGGTGTWDVAAAATNWTDASGAGANAWGQGGLAIFAGTAGTVTVGGATPPQTAGMEFLTEGYTVTGGSIALTAFSAGTAPTILTDSGFTATIGSALTGTDGLEKTGTGRLILTGANTYTGGTTISAGTLQVGTGGTSGSLAGDIVNKGALVFYRSDDLAYAGVVSGTGTLEKLGAGTLTLSGTTAGISGQVTIGAGGLTLTHDQAQAMLTGNIVDNGALTIYRNTADGIYAGSISGTGTLTKTGAKNLYLTGANTYTGGTTISAGQITIGQGGATGSIAGDVAIASGAGLGYYRTGTETFAGNISGAGSWGVGGGLTLTYTGASTTTGIVYMQASTVQVGDGGTAGSIAGDIVTDFQGANPGHLIFNRSDDLTYAGAISGSGTLEKKGAGTLTLTGASTLTGGTTITAGTLSIGAGGTSGSLTGAIANSGALVFDRSDALTYAGVVSGTGTLEKKGAGTLTLSGAHTYTGGTTVTAGTLSIGAGGTSGSVTGDITNAGALVFDRSDAVAYAGVVSGTGSLEQKGAGTLTLTGAQTYTGNTTVTAGTLRLTGSINAPAGTVQVGDATFATAGGGQLTAQGIGIGVAAGTSGTATVDGTGSGWTIGSDRIGVGRDGTGTLTISGGATVSSPGAIIGWNSTGTGTATVTGTGSTWTNAGTLYVGNGGTGTLSVAAGGHVTSAGAYIGTGGSSTGTVTVSGQGSLWEAGNALIAGYSAGTTGHVTISGGGQVKAVIATLGEQAGSTGTMQVTGAGSKLIAVNDGTPYAGNINVGQNGSGRLTVAAGGAVEGGKLYIGNDSGSGAVSVAGAGSSVTLASTLTVGADANGTLTLSDGGQVSASSVTIGNSPGVSGTLAIGAASGQAAAAPGALAANSIRFGAGNGRLVLNHTGAAYTIAAPISGGGQVRQEGGGATLLTGANTYTGGTTITSGTLSIGAGGTSGSLAGDIANAGALVFDRSDAVTYAGVISGSGTLAQKGTGTLTLTGANTLTGGTTITAGTLSIGDGGTAGSLTGAIANAAALVFNRSDDLTYADVISGAGTLEKTGAGTLTLSGANTLTGATTVSAGTLALTGSLAGDLTVSSGATLSGAGSVGGSLTIANGGALAGKSGSTLTVTGDLAQGATSQLNLTLGAPTTTAVVSAANLTLAGTLNLTPRSGFASGSYRLMDYSGTLTDLTLAIGTAPSHSLYRVDTGTSHQVNLVVAAGQWWNGATTSAGGSSVAGGTGTWDVAAAATNWTDASGAAANAWGQGGLAIFAGTAGTVTVSGATPPQTAGMEFLSDGYTVTGGSIALTVFSAGTAPKILTETGVTATIASALTGTDGLEKTSAGTLVLAGANTYTGGTTITAGTLAIGAGGTSGSVAGTIANGGALVFNRSDDLTYAGVVSGTGTLDKQGAGTLTLTGTSTYTGATTVSAGTLALTGTARLASDVTVQAGATLAGLSGAAGPVVAGAVTLQDGATLRTAPSAVAGVYGLSVDRLTLAHDAGLALTLGVNTGNAAIRAGTLALDGVLNVTNAGGMALGVYRIIDYGTLASDNGLRLGTTPAAYAYQVQRQPGQVNLAVLASGESLYWNGSTTSADGTVHGGSGTWTNDWTRTNWTDGSASQSRSWNSSFPVFAGTGGTVTIDPANGPVSVTGTQFMVDGYTVTGGGLVLGSPTGRTQVRVGDGTAAGTAMVARVFAPISGLTGLEKTDLGTLILGGDNTYTGGTVVSAGTLQIGAGGTTGSIQGDVVNNATLAFNRSDDTAFAGVISGSGAVVKQGAGTLTLSGSNTYAGTTRVAEGTLQVSAAEALGTGLLALQGGGTLRASGTFTDGRGISLGPVNGQGGGTVEVDDRQTLTLAGSLTGAGGLTKTGTGTLVLGGANSFTGATTIGGGLLVVGGGASLSDTARLTVGAGAGLRLTDADETVGSLAGAGSVALNGHCLVAGGDGTSSAFSGTLSGAGCLTKTGSGTLTLSGSNTYAGTTRVAEGTLQVSAAEALGTGPLALQGGGTLRASGTFTDGRGISLGPVNGQGGGTVEVDDRQTLTLAGSLTGAGGLTKTGTGTLVLGGANSFTGATTIGGGLLVVGGGASLSDTARLTVGAGAGLRLTDADETVGSLAGAGSVALNGHCLVAGGDGTSSAFSGTLSGAGCLTKTGSGTLTLSGSNTYAGTTRVAEGTLQVSAAEALGTGPLALQGGGTLRASGTFTDGRGISLSPVGGQGGGTVEVDDRQTLTLAGSLTGAGGLTKTGTGTLVLGGANSFTGATTIGGGLLVVGGGASLSDTARLTVGAGAGLRLTDADEIVGSLAGAGSVALNGHCLVAGGDGTSSAFSGALSGAGGCLTKTGSGTLTLSGSNTYAGTTRVAEGTLQVSAAEALGTGPLALQGGGTLRASGTFTDGRGISLSPVGGQGGGTVEVDDRQTLTLTGSIAGLGGLAKTGTGTLVLGGANGYAGATAVDAGTLIASGGQAIGDTSAVSVALGARLILRGDETVGSLSGNGAVELDGASLALGGDNTSTIFAGALSGNGGLTKTGTGTLTLAGANAYTGDTRLAGGTLALAGSVDGDIYVQDKATLSGGGRVGKTVHVLDGGTLAGSPGNGLTMGGLDLKPASTLAVTLGAPSSAGVFQVNGNVTLGGTLAVTPTPGFGLGVYRIVNYTGRLTDTGLRVGALAGGLLGGVQTSVANQVNLFVEDPNSPVAFWNGSQTSPTQSVAGGTGTWSADARTNWTNAGGTISRRWNGGFAVFQGTPGIVTVDNAAGTVSAKGMQFVDSGYVVRGGTIALPESGTAAIRVGDGTAAGATTVATIAASLTGGARLEKSDYGTLILTGTNSYAGGTSVAGGTLRVGGDGALGAASGGMTLDGGTLSAAASFTTGRALTLGAAGGTLAVTAASDTLTLTGTVSGEGGLIKTGSGKVLMLGTGTYAGTTRIAEGTLQIGNGGTAGSISGAVVNEATLVFNRSDTYAFQGNITGKGQVNFEGGGRVLFTATDAYTGPVSVTDTVVRLDPGSATTSPFVANAGGVIGGTATIGGLTVNGGGTASPGYSPGTLTVKGPVAFNAGALYAVDVTPTGEHDLIAATGPVSLSSQAGVQVHAVAGRYSPTAKYTILTTTGTVSGRFGSVTSDYAFLDPDLSYDAQNVYLGLRYTGRSFAEFAQTSNQRAVAGAAQGLKTGNAVHDALLMLTDRQVAPALDQLSGEGYASAWTVLQQRSSALREAVGARLRQSGDGIGDALAAASRAAGPATVELTDDVRATVWAQAFGSLGHTLGTWETGTLKASEAGFLAGLDLRPLDTLRIGVVAGLSRSSLNDAPRSTSGTLSNVDLGIYAGWTLGNLSLQGGVAQSWHEITASRRVTFPGLSGSGSDRLATAVRQIFGEAAYSLTLGDATVQPFVGLANVSADGAALRERGGATALSGRIGSQSVTYATVGVRAAMDVALGDRILTPSVTLGWQRAFGELTPKAALTFSGTELPFLVGGVPIERNVAAVGAGLSYALSDRERIQVNYTGQLGARTLRNGFSAQYSLRF